MKLKKYIIRRYVKTIFWIKKYRYPFIGVISLLTIWYYFCLPQQLFKDPFSTVVLGENGELLGARIAKDGQWRFPHNEKVPYKFAHALITFEDKRFYRHMGVDVKAIGRAVKSNFTEGEVVSGASTLTMQVIRMARKKKSRSLYQKMIEMIWATRLEWRSSKKEILSLYASNAPFGGNVVGLDAAAWKYFGIPAEKLSWAESATLAVLPNSPGLIHPGRNRKKLHEKRDRLLAKLYQKKVIDETTYQLALLEPLPQKPIRLPDVAPHLVASVGKNSKKKGIHHTSINTSLQKRVNAVIERHHKHLENHEIHHLAALIIEVKTGKIIAYNGNVSGGFGEEGNAVDMIQAKRSTGSILKPILYANILEEGLLFPKQLIQDVPTYYGSYTPKNYSYTYDGAVPADEALARSLNIPAVKMLEKFGLHKFHQRLQDHGFTTFDQKADHYGLSLILGGGETTMYDLGAVYSKMAHQLKYGEKSAAQYVIEVESKPEKSSGQHLPIHNAAIWQTFEVMTQVNRPGVEINWEYFNSEQKVAWKTGTSFGHRDAWAVGITPKHVVVVWSGNANGEGRPEIIGAKTAGPVLFDIINELPQSQSWFLRPDEELHQVITCNASGLPATKYCRHTREIHVKKGIHHVGTCTYCQPYLVDKKSGSRVKSSCYSPQESIQKNYFTLPPHMEYYYRKKHPEYQVLPKMHPRCESEVNMDLTYPGPNAKVYIPTLLNGKRGEMVLEAKVKGSSRHLYWHIDEQYLGETSGKHQLAVSPSKGKHVVKIVDNNGAEIKRNFLVIH